MSPRYETLEASTQTHRASAPYKQMRAAVGAEDLFEGPSDLRYLQPQGRSFLRRDRVPPIVVQGLKSENGQDMAFAVVEELQPRSETVCRLRQATSEVVDLARQNVAIVDTCLHLQYLAKAEDDTIVILTIHPSELQCRVWAMASAELR